MKSTKQMKFFSRLMKVCIGNTLVSLLSIPFSVAISKLIANMLSAAIDGSVRKVIRLALWIILILTVYVVVSLISDNYLKRVNSKSRNCCRTDFMKLFLSNPLYRLHSADQGTVIQNINKDLEVVLNCYTGAYPGILAALVTIAAYLIFMLIQNPVVTAVLFVLGLIQLIPPMIIRNYIQVNYDECSKLDEQITDHITEGVRGFEVIKLYDLKNTWLGKLREFHGKYLKVGSRSSAAYAAEFSLSRFTENILLYGNYAVIGLFIMNGGCTMSFGVQALYLSGGLFGAIGAIAGNIPSLSLRKKSEERLAEWIPSESGGEEVVICEPFGDIDIKNISVRYDEHEVLRNFSLHFLLTAIT